MAAIGKCDGAQILDKPGKGIHLQHETLKRRLIRFEHTVDHAAQLTFEDSERRAQLVGNGCIPELHIRRHILQTLGHGVEVLDEMGCLSQRMITRQGARRKIAVLDASCAVGRDSSGCRMRRVKRTEAMAATMRAMKIRAERMMKSTPVSQLSSLSDQG